MTITESIVKNPQNTDQSRPILAQIGLIPLGITMVMIGVVLRHVDVFVFCLGDTWMNILPCKVLSLIILLGVFWKYRRNEIESVLGLSNNNLRYHLILGAVIGIGIILASNIISTLVYYFVFDSSIPIHFSILLGPDMLVYSFIFFAINAVYEETLFRGLLQNGFREKVGPNRAILYSAIVFGFWHLVWPLQTFLLEGVFPVQTAAVMVIFSGLLGAVFGICYEKFTLRKSLVITIVAHTFINYLNESFKVAFDTVTQGPDLSFINSLHMAIGLICTLGTFAFLIVFFIKYNLGQIKDWVEQKDLHNLFRKS